MAWFGIKKKHRQKQHTIPYTVYLHFYTRTVHGPSSVPSRVTFIPTSESSPTFFLNSDKLRVHSRCKITHNKGGGGKHTNTLWSSSTREYNQPRVGVCKASKVWSSFKADQSNKVSGTMSSEQRCAHIVSFVHRS